MLASADICFQPIRKLLNIPYAPETDLRSLRAKTLRENLPLGCILAIVTLKECCTTKWMSSEWKIFGLNEQERAFGNYDTSRYGLVTDNVRRLRTPIPFKSRQGKLLDVPQEIEQEIRRQQLVSAFTYGKTVDANWI